jgi:hypothetical protein
VELRSDLLGGDDGDVFGQRRIQGLRRALGGRAADGVHARHLARGVHPGVRPSCDGEPVPLRVDGS